MPSNGSQQATCPWLWCRGRWGQGKMRRRIYKNLGKDNKRANRIQLNLHLTLKKVHSNVSVHIVKVAPKKKKSRIKMDNFLKQHFTDSSTDVVGGLKTLQRTKPLWSVSVLSAFQYFVMSSVRLVACCWLHTWKYWRYFCRNIHRDLEYWQVYFIYVRRWKYIGHLRGCTTHLLSCYDVYRWDRMKAVKMLTGMKRNPRLWRIFVILFYSSEGHRVHHSDVTDWVCMRRPQ